MPSRVCPDPVRRFARGGWLAGALLATALVGGACSVAGLGEADPADATPTSASSAATPTRAAPLRIVTPTPFVAGATTTAGQTPTAETEVPEVYVVQENDTLYGIAVRFNVELDDLIALNGLSDPNDIQVGQELRLPREP